MNVFMVAMYNKENERHESNMKEANEVMKVNKW